ncbi:hypothetical protein [Herbidospora sp. RD11066]
MRRNIELRDAVWREAIFAAQQEEHGDLALLFALWLAQPWISRVVAFIGSRIRADPEDVEAEMTTALLEELPNTNPDLPGAGDRLLQWTARKAWASARAGVREIPVPDTSAYPEQVHFDAAWELSISPPPRTDGLSAPIRFTGTSRQAEGERLGMLAHHFGLADIVYRARRPTEGDPIGNVFLRKVGAAK